MDKIIIGGIDIRDYLPEKFPEEHIPKVVALGLAIQNAIRERMLIGFSHEGTRRITMVHDMFGQHPTSKDSTAERAIGISAYQIHSDKPEESKNGWKTFFLHKIDGLEVFIGERIRSVFQLDTDDINGIQLTGKFDIRPDFDEFWRLYQREILEQTPSGNNARKHPGLVLLQK